MPISEHRRSELASRTDAQIDDSDIPELDDAHKATGKGDHSRMNAVLESDAKTLKKCDGKSHQV